MAFDRAQQLRAYKALLRAMEIARDRGETISDDEAEKIVRRFVAEEQKEAGK